MQRNRTEPDLDVLAICRRERDGWRVLILRENDSGSRVEGHFKATDSECAQRLEQASVGRMLVLLPSSAYLTRTIRLPDAAGPQLHSAMRLEAESRYLGSIPEHRLGMAVLGEGTPNPVGIVTSWPETVQVPCPPLPPNQRIEVHWIPDIAALAAIAHNGTAFAAMFDAQTNSLAAIVDTPMGSRFRSTRAQVTDAKTWADQIRALVIETLVAEDLPTDDVHAHAEAAARVVAESQPNSHHFVVLPDDADARLQKTAEGSTKLTNGPDADGWRILLGAHLAQTGPLAPLAELQETEKKENPGFVRNITNRLGSGRVAVGVVTAAILLIILTPILASGLRLMIVSGKVDNVKSYEASVRRTENLIEVYRSLDRQAWSMTKMLGDISNCIPETIETSSIVLKHGEPITVQGIAKSPGDVDGTDAVLEFAHRLRESGLFEEVHYTVDPADGRGIREFHINAEVRSQTSPARFSEEDDYAITSFSERRWGPVDDDGYLITEGSESTPLASGDSTPESTAQDGEPSTAEEIDETTAMASAENSDEAGSQSTRPGSSREARSRESSRSSSGSTRRRSEAQGRDSGRPGPPPIPDPITAEEVRAMNRAEALSRLSKVAEAKNQAGLDDAVKERLKADFDLLMERVRETAQ
ncbi:MAG: hypothetical protein MK085_12205 [Phycisphaerales bacterium]|nr:hypothetical protein [Phycisphaerales bacterium]